MNGQNDALITLLALVGKAGAGKDTILRYLCDHYDVNEVISCTTRPPREGEVDGVNYHFLSESEFAERC
jgi:guanylate kinase